MAARPRAPAPSPEWVATIRDALLGWYAGHARDLPWRTAGTGAWGVLVSELMLQQTPVARVEPVWRAWMRRWPTPADLAADPPGAAVRAWGGLGYPRRALRLHACAGEIVTVHGGAVPSDPEELRRLPGVGAYTAAAVAAFAHGRRVAVLDTNVRRVLGRLLQGVAGPLSASPTRSERAVAEAVLPDDDTAARWSAAVMELGALVCTARSPRCEVCPVAKHCAWLALGRPSAAPRTRRQPYAGTDRHCRGRLLAAVRRAPGPVSVRSLDVVWDEPVQRVRALAGLVEDGLLARVGADAVALPGTSGPPNASAVS